MDEEALKDAHKLFIETGYDGNLHDFKNLVSTNPEAMKDAHKLFTDTGYSGSEEDFSTLIGASTKKEQAVSSESPLDSAQKPSTSDTSEEKKETQPTESSLSEKDKEPIVRPDREEAIEPDLDLDTASLYDQYKEAGKLTLPQQKKIDQQLTAAEKGERGVWENINAYSTGFLTTGTAIPIYKSYTEDELIKERIEKNKTDFLAELPEDVLAELRAYNIDRTVELTSTDLNLLAQNRIIKEKSKAMAFSLDQMHNNIIKIRESGERVPDEAFQMYEDLYKEVEAQGMLFMENVDLIEAAEDSIGNFEEELDLFKKNYGGLDYYKDITRLATATMIGGLMEVAKTGIEMAPLNPVSAEFKKGALKTGDFTKDFREEITEQQGELRTQLSVDDIESIEDFFQWLGEQTASQLPVLTVLMASGGSSGLVALSASSGGTKMGEMKDEVAAGDEDYTKEEIFFTGMGFAALEFITEKASLGILSKGSRTLKASLKGGAPTESFGKSFAKGFGQNFKAQFKEGSTEFGNTLGQNVLEIVYLEKEGLHVFDNTADAFASGQAMGSGMHAVPAIMGFGIKTFVNKGQQKKMRRDALKLEELTNELESNENLSEESKTYIQNKINAIAESANADLKQIDINLQEIGEDAVQELINLDKEANGIFQEVKVIEESELSDEMKAELKVENKKKIEAISKKKEVLLNNGETRSSKEVVNRPVRLTKLGGSVLDVPIEGDLYIEGQTLVVKEKNGNITELGNAEALADTNIKELGIDVAQDVIKVNNDGSITVEGNTWNIQRDLPTRGVQTNEDGSVKNVSLKDNNGKTVQYEGAVAEDLAYQIKLDEKSGIEPKTQAKVDTKAKAKAQAKVREANKKRADERAERGNKVQEADGSKSSVDGNDKGVQPNSIGAKEFSKIDLSESVGLSKVIETLDKWDAGLKKAGKETLGMNIPVVVAQAAVTAMRVAAKTAKTGADIISAGLNAVQKSDWYLKQGKSVRKDIDKNLVRRISEAGEGSKSADAVTTPHKVKKKKVKTKTQIRKSTGQTDTSAKVTTSKRNALREKLRTEAKAALKGYRAGRKDLQWAKNSLKQLIATYIKEGSGLYTKGEVKRLLAKINKVTDKNFEVVSKETVAYIENHIENRQAKGRISGLKKKLKAAAKKTAQATRNVKRLAEQATLIDQRYLNKNDLGRYEVLLGKILAATKGVTVKGYKAVDVDSAYNEALALFSKAEDNKNAQLNEEAGIEVTELTEEELETLSKEKVAKAREVLLDMAEERTSILRSIDISGFSPKHRRWYNHMITAPFDKLGIPALKEFIRVADNIAMNEDFTSAYSKIVSKIVVGKRANTFLNGIENSKLGKRAIKVVEKGLLTDAKDMSLIMKQMFGGSKGAHRFNFASGFASLSKAYELSKAKAVELEKRYEKVIKGVKKRHPKVLKAENVVSRGIFANLIQGTTEKDFEINKRKIEVTIKNLKNLKETRKQGELAERIYEEVKDLKTQEEVLAHVKGKKDGNYELLDFWMKEFADISEDLRASTEEVFGESYREVTGNYLPIGNIRTGKLIAEDLDRPSHMSGVTTPKQAPTTMARVQSKSLPSEYMLNLEFDSVMFRKYEKSSYDIHVSEARFDIKNFLKDPSVRSKLGGDNVKLLEASLDRVLKIQRNAMEYDRSALGMFLSKAASTLKTLAAVRALGSISAYPKQFTGVIFNAAIRLGAEAPLLFSAATDLIKGDIPIVNQSLARRGQIEGGTRNAYQKPSAAEKKAIHNMADSFTKGLGRVANEQIRQKLFWSLRTGDTHAAKVTWLAYYKKYLKNNSDYDIDGLDMSTEHLRMEGDVIRQKAASYAQQHVEETQIATDESRESKLYSQESSTAIKVFRDVVLPYSRFVIQAKMRMMVDYGNFRDAVKEGDTDSARDAAASFAGTLVEQTVFHGMNYFILKPMVMMTENVIRSLITGSDEGDEEVDWEFKTKQFASKLATDAVPVLIGQGMENSFIELVNYMDYALNSDTSVFDSQKDYEKFLRGINKNKLLYRYGDEDGFSVTGTMAGFGVYEGVYDGFSDLYDTRKYAFDKVVTTDGYYGNEKHVIVRKKDKGFMQVMFFLELLSASGLMEAEVYRAMKREQRKKVKRAIKVKVK